MDGRCRSASAIAQASAVSTKGLTEACGFSGRDAGTQQDVQELCRVLFDALGRSAQTLAVEIDYDAHLDLYS